MSQQQIAVDSLPFIGNFIPQPKNFKLVHQLDMQFGYFESGVLPQPHAPFFRYFVNHIGFNSITNLNGLSRVYGKQLQYLDLCIMYLISEQNKINNIQPLALLPNSFISQLNLKGNVGLVHLRQLIKCQFYLEEGFFEFTNPPKREKRNLKDIFGKRFKNSTSIKI